MADGDSMQLNLTLPDPAEARANGERLSRACTDKAESKSPGFADIAADVAEQYLRAMHSQGKIPVSSESITNAIKRAGVVPHDDRAFGSVIRRLVQRGVIEFVGNCTRTRGNGARGGSLWKLSPTWKGIV